jgi:hypothetical protein
MLSAPAIVVLPVLETRKSEVVAEPVVEAMLKRLRLESVRPAKMVSLAFGVVVPTPTLPLAARKSDEVPTSEFVPLKYGSCPRVPVMAAW